MNIHVLTYLFVVRENLILLFRKITVANNLSEFIDQVAIKVKFQQSVLHKCFQTDIICGHKFRMTAIKL